MTFTVFRVLLLLWNNLPAWFRRFLRAVGMTRFVNEIWLPYRHLTIPPTERPVRALVENIVQPGWCCADVGANFGMMTEVMAVKARPGGSVVAFEAHPLNVTILRRRMEFKELDQIVTIENKAVSDGTEKSLWLFPGRRKSPNEWNIVGRDVIGKRMKAEMEIPAVSLDEYFGTAPLHFVKIDVEGAESGVIAGMERILAEQRPICIVEFHNLQACESRHGFLSRGYRIYTLSGQELSPASPSCYHALLWPPGSDPSPDLFASQPS